jgi:Family of unknown function (DUF6788)
MANKTDVDLSSLTVRQLRARRRGLAKRMGDPEMTLRGTLISQGRRCGKAGCRCAEGHLHGPYTYLSVGRATGTARLLYVPAPLADAVSKNVAATEAAEAALAEISAINLELLSRRELQ